LRHFKLRYHVFAVLGKLTLATILLLGGCSPASVTPVATSVPLNTAPPHQIAVYNFATSPSEVQLNQGIFQRAYRAVSMSGEEQQEAQTKEAHAAADALTDETVKQLQGLGLNAEKLDRGTPPPEGAVVIDGQFTDIDEGNRLRRLVIGLGAGSSKLDTQVNVYRIDQGSTDQLLNFTTHAQSGKMPGAAETMGVGAAAQGGLTVGVAAASAGVGGIKTYRSSIDSLADDTAKQIVAYYSQYAASQGWIGQAKIERVNYSGSTP
jgi:hypothetical protein